MYHLYLKRNSFDQSNAFKVYDDTSHIKYIIKGRRGRLGDDIRLYDLHDHCLASAVQSSWGLNPNYILSQEDQKIGRMAKTFLFQQGLYKLSQLNWMVDGDNDSKDYAIFDKDGQRLCNFKLAISGQGEKYCLTYQSRDDEVLYCLIATLVDQDVYVRDPFLQKKYEFENT